MKKELYLKNTKENEILIKSIFHVLKEINITCKKTKDYFILSIICESCELFMDKIKNKESKYILLHNFVISFIDQIKFLEKNKYTFYNIDTEKIYLINNEISICIDEEIIEIIEKKIKINNIFKKDKYCSPELYEIIDLPNKISYKSIYFSIGIFLFKNLVEGIEESLFYQLKKEEKIENKINILIKIDKKLNEIKYTKMYFFIKKNINIDESKRLLIYI
jgi:hypothetical protein